MTADYLRDLMKLAATPGGVMRLSAAQACALWIPLYAMGNGARYGAAEDKVDNLSHSQVGRRLCVWRLPGATAAAYDHPAGVLLVANSFGPCGVLIPGPHDDLGRARLARAWEAL